MKPIIIAYVPVVHRGYLDFFSKHPDVEKIFVLGEEFIAESEYLHKEIRSLTPEEAKDALTGTGLEVPAEILTKETAEEIASSGRPIIIPREDITEQIAAKYFPENPTTVDKIFLRWDRKNTTKEFTVDPDVSISEEELDREFMQKAGEQKEKSSDWWRQVGAAVAKDGQIVLAGSNKHLPSEHTPYLNGDPRNCFSKGVHIDLSTAIHAEAGLIAEAAKKGLSLENASMYVTTFPCPVCAKLIAQAGIKNLYFAEGYGMLDGKSVLKNAGITIAQVTSQA